MGVIRSIAAASAYFAQISRVSKLRQTLSPVLVDVGQGCALARVCWSRRRVRVGGFALVEFRYDVVAQSRRSRCVNKFIFGDGCFNDRVIVTAAPEFTYRGIKFGKSLHAQSNLRTATK